MRDSGITPADRAILTHCQVLGADLIEMMVGMGVIANIQPSFVPTDMEWASSRLTSEVLQVCLHHSVYSAKLICAPPCILFHLSVLICMEDFDGIWRVVCGRIRCPRGDVLPLGTQMYTYVIVSAMTNPVVSALGWNL